MSRRKKRPHGPKKRPPRPRTAAERDEDVIAGTTQIFTCFTEVTHDFLHQVTSEQDRLTFDLDYNRLAIQMWRGGPGRAAELVTVLEELRALREHHLAVLGELRARLSALIATPTHVHLEDVDRWREIIRQCVLQPTPPP